MKNIILFIGIYLLSTNCVNAQPIAYTHYYCYSGGELYILPLNTASTCDIARCMFENYFYKVKKTIDYNTIQCTSTAVSPPYIVVNNPVCPPPPKIGGGQGGGPPPKTTKDISIL